MIGPVPKVWGGEKWVGGVATHVHGLVNALVKQNWKINLLADNTTRKINPSILPAELHVEMAPRSIGVIQKNGLSKSVEVFNRANRKIQSELDIPPVSRLKLIAQAISYQPFVEKHESQLIHVQHAQHRQFVVKELINHRGKLLSTVQGVNELLEADVRPWFKKMVMANYQRADGLIAVSNFVREMLIEFAAPAENIVVIPNGVDVDEFHPASRMVIRKELDLPLDKRIVLYTGNFIVRKSVDDLLLAMRELNTLYPDLVLLLVGDGPLRVTLEQITQQFQISDRTIFFGRVPNDQIAKCYQAADCFVLPSKSEGLSLSLLEAMSTGIPVITTNPSRGAHDAIIHGENGLLYDWGERKTLAELLEWVINDEKAAVNMGKNARETVLKKFTWDQIAVQTIQVYEDMMNDQ